MQTLYSASYLADFLIKYSVTEHDDTYHRLGALKISQVIFFIDCYFIAKTKLKKSLINEDYEAWRYGAIIPSLHERFKYQRVGDFSLRDIYKDAEINKEDLEIIRPAIEFFLPINVSNLVNLVRDSPAWKEARNNPYKEVKKIDKTKMPNFYFEKVLNE